MIIMNLSWDALLFVMQDGENLTQEQIADEIKKIKNAHAEDEGTYLFPDLELVVYWKSLACLA